MYRDTYVEVNLKNVKENVEKIVKKYNNYAYHFGVVKADCYGHGIEKTVNAIIEGGANYLAVATLDEAIEIRKNNKNIPILCLGVVYNKDLEIAISNNITLTISSLDYLNTLDVSKLQNSKVHIKLNTGMNRLGVANKDEFNKVYKKLVQCFAEIEGVYSHIYNADNKETTQNQFNKFTSMLSDIDLSKIKIVHIQASDAFTLYNKPSFANGCRMGIIMYGFSTDKTLDLKSTFKVYSTVIQINNLKKGDTVGYNAKYEAKSDEKTAVIPIGYADGIIRKNEGRNIYINGKPFTIVGNVCMDMLFAKVDDSVKLFDKVEIIKDKEHIEEIANYLDTITYEVMCEFGKRVPRVYIN